MSVDEKEFNVFLASFGIILEVINFFSVITIGVLFQLLLKQYHSKLSIIYLISRILEGFFLLLSIISIVPLIFGKETTAHQAELISSYNNWFQIGMLFLGIGSLFLLTLLKRENILPDAFFILGVISYLALFTSSIMDLANVVSNLTMILYLPGTVFEIAFPLRLIKEGVRKNESNIVQRI